MSFTFADLGVPADLVAVLGAQGIEKPFAIQQTALPDALAGHDVCGRAPTGSGKTLAFGLAVVAACAADGFGGGTGRRGPKPRPGRRVGRPQALVLVPTRELAAQVEAVLAPLAKAVGARVTSIYGGVGYGGQRAALGRGVDIVVGCPGRLEDLVAQGDVSFSDTKVVVIDEADRMADMGFLPAVKRLLDVTNPEGRQTLLFSAT
ncbi:MAG: DEAD/DEAH box helicase, partial [Acidimicrobiales bacterium]